MGRVAKSRVRVGSGFEIFFRVRVGFGLAKKFSGLVRVCQKKGKKVYFTTKRWKNGSILSAFEFFDKYVLEMSKI